MNNIQQQINEINARLNQIASDANLISELPTVQSGEKFLAVQNTTTNQTEKINLTDISSQAGLPDGIVQLGVITVTEITNTINFSNNFIWRIGGVLYTNEPQSFVINLATDLRRDIFVLTDASNILRVQGEDSPTPVAPAVPVGTIYLTEILVTNSSIGEPVTPDLVGFVQKVYFDYSKISLDVETLPADGRTNFTLETPLATFKGFDGTSELYRGKRFIIRNGSGSDCELLAGQAVDLPFADTIVLADGENIEFDVFNNELKRVGSEGGGGTWGSITGTLSDQTDLQAALDAKLEIVNTFDIVDEAVTNDKFRNSTAHTVVGRAGSGNGSVDDIGLSNDTILGREGSGNVEGLSVSQIKSMLAINNVDNTSDADKPISDATQDALDLKLDKEELTRTPTLGEIDTETIFSDRVVILDVGSTDTTVTILTALNNVLFKKKGSGIVTFVSDTGRTLRTLTNNLNVLTADGGMALLFADGTTDNLYVNDGEQPALLRSGYRKGVILDTDFTLGGGVQTADVGLSEAYPDASYDIWITFYRASGSLFSYHYIIPEASVTSTGFQLILNTGSAVTGLKIKYQTFRDE